jgi:hypothetical protein
MQEKEALITLLNHPTHIFQDGRGRNMYFGVDTKGNLRSAIVTWNMEGYTLGERLSYGPHTTDRMASEIIVQSQNKGFRLRLFPQPAGEKLGTNS